MVELKITEYIKTVNIYTLKLDKEYAEKLNQELRRDFICTDGQEVPYISEDILEEIAKTEGNFYYLNRKRYEADKPYLEPVLIVSRNWSQDPGMLLYDLIYDLMIDNTRDGGHVIEWDSEVEDWNLEVDEVNDEKEN